MLDLHKKPAAEQTLHIKTVLYRYAEGGARSGDGGNQS